METSSKCPLEGISGRKIRTLSTTKLDNADVEHRQWELEDVDPSVIDLLVEQWIWNPGDLDPCRSGSLKIFKVRVNGALSHSIQLGMSLFTAGRLTYMTFRSLVQPSAFYDSSSRTFYKSSSCS